MSVQTAPKLNPRASLQLNQRAWGSSSSRRPATHFSLSFPSLFPFSSLGSHLHYLRLHSPPSFPFLSPSFVLSFSSLSFSHFLQILSLISYTHFPHTRITLDGNNNSVCYHCVITVFSYTSFFFNIILSHRSSSLFCHKKGRRRGKIQLLERDILLRKMIIP